MKTGLVSDMVTIGAVVSIVCISSPKKYWIWIVITNKRRIFNPALRDNSGMNCALHEKKSRSNERNCGSSWNLCFSQVGINLSEGPRLVPPLG